MIYLVVNIYFFILVEQLIEKEKQEAIEKTIEGVTDKIAINLLKSGSNLEFVAENTNLSLEAVKRLKEQL